MTAPRPSSDRVLRRTLLWGALLAAVVAAVASPIGWAVAGGPGLAGAILGAVMALVFLGATAASILLANRLGGAEPNPGLFFGIVMGGWIVKLVLFLVAAVLLRDATWLDARVLFTTLVVVVVGSLVVDVVVLAKSRIPAVSDLPPSRRID